MSSMMLLFKITNRTGQWNCSKGKTLLCKTDDLNVMSRTHIKVEENWPYKVVLWPSHKCHKKCVYIHLHTHRSYTHILVSKNFKIKWGGLKITQGKHSKQTLDLMSKHSDSDESRDKIQESSHTGKRNQREGMWSWCGNVKTTCFLSWFATLNLYT